MVNRENSVAEKIKEALEKLGEAVDEWLTRQGLKPKPVPIPIDRRPPYDRYPQRRH